MIKLYPPTLGGPAREDELELDEHIRIVLNHTAANFQRRSRSCRNINEYIKKRARCEKFNSLKKVFQKKYGCLEEIKDDLRKSGLARLAKSIEMEGYPFDGEDKRRIRYKTYLQNYLCSQTFAIVAEIE